MLSTILIVPAMLPSALFTTAIMAAVSPSAVTRLRVTEMVAGVHVWVDYDNVAIADGR